MAVIDVKLFSVIETECNESKLIAAVTKVRSANKFVWIFASFKEAYKFMIPPSYTVILVNLLSLIVIALLSLRLIREDAS